MYSTAARQVSECVDAAIAAAVITAMTDICLIQVYIVDFGLAELTPDAECAKHDGSYMFASFQGTPDYASRDALNGFISSAKVSDI